MWRCKQVSQALADGKYWDLPPRKRWALRLHAAICPVCGFFNRYVMMMQDATRHYLKHEQEDTPPEHLRLPADAKKKIAATLKSTDPRS
jgi:hypothetical protein